ncbi:protein kinase domain-containing protein [Lacunimicrobium album]
MSSEMEKKRSSSRRDATPGKASSSKPPKSGSKSGSSSSDDLTGRKLGRYSIVKKIGSGGMGAVYLAKDSTLDRTVALKILPAEKAENPTLVKRFRAEAKASAMLDHENIVGVYDSGEIEGLNYISMEYIDGIDVSDLIKRKGTVGVKRSIDIVRQIAMALQHANERNIVHRDIKPSNFMITREGVVKLADMGLARAIDEATETSITRAGSTVGTIDYMAPEQARSSKAADTRSDIYSLGCAWFHMLAGHPPFNEGSVTNKLQAHAVAALPDLRKINESVPMGVIAMISRMMAKRPDERYQSPDELLEDLANENIFRSDIAEEGLDALAREVVEEKAKKPAKATLPPKEKRLAKVDNEPNGFLEAVLSFVPVVIVAGISVGVIVLMWWGLSGFGSALSGSGQANLQKTAEEEANNELLNKEGKSLVESTVVRRPGDPATGTLQNSNNTSPAVNLQEGTMVMRAGMGAGQTENHPARATIAADWYDADRLPAKRVSAKKNFEPVDTEFAAQLASIESADGVLELTDDGPYVLTKSYVIKSPRLVLRAARGMKPVVLYSPENGNSKEATTLFTFSGGKHLIDGIEFVTILGEAGHERPTDFIRMSDGTKLDVVNSGFSQEGTSQTGKSVNAIRLLGGVVNPSLRGFQNVFRGEDLTAINLNTNNGDVELTRCLAFMGRSPITRITDPKEQATDAAGADVQRSLTVKESLFAGGASFLRFDSANRTTASPITKVTADQTRFIEWPSTGAVPSEQRAWIVGDQLTNIDPAAGTGSIEQSLQLELSKLQFAGFDQMFSGQDQKGQRQTAASISDLESQWKARWLDLTASPSPVASTVFRDVASRTTEAFDLALVASLSVTTSQPSLKAEDYRCLSRLPLEKQLVLQSTLQREDVDRLFEGAETFRVEIPRQKLQDVLNNDRLPQRAIIEVRGAGEIELPATLLEDKLLRIDFGKPGDIILRPLELKSTIAQRADDKLPFESLLTMRNGLLDLQAATIVLPASKSLNTPIWAVTSDRGHILLDRCQLVGPPISDSLHAGLIRQVSRPQTPIGKSMPELTSAATFITNSTLFSPKTVYESDYLQPRLKIHNSGVASLSNAILLSAKASAGSQSSKARVELSNTTISSGQAAISITGEAAASSVAVPLIIQDCVFAPRLDIKPEVPSGPLLNLGSGAKAYSFWWFNNGITSTRAEITSQVTQSGGTVPTEWSTLWKPGHDAGTLFGADGVLMSQAMPEPKDYDIADLALSPTCQAMKWSTTGGPIGVDVKLLDELFKAAPSSPNQGSLREPQRLPGGKLVRPGF